MERPYKDLQLASGGLGSLDTRSVGPEVGAAEGAGPKRIFECAGSWSGPGSGGSGVGMPGPAASAPQLPGCAALVPVGLQWLVLAAAQEFCAACWVWPRTRPAAGRGEPFPAGVARRWCRGPRLAWEAIVSVRIFRVSWNRSQRLRSDGPTQFQLRRAHTPSVQKWRGGARVHSGLDAHGRWRVPLGRCWGSRGKICLATRIGCFRCIEGLGRPEVFAPQRLPLLHKGGGTPGSLHQLCRRGLHTPWSRSPDVCWRGGHSRARGGHRSRAGTRHPRHSLPRSPERGTVLSPA